MIIKILDLHLPPPLLQVVRVNIYTLFKEYKVKTTCMIMYEFHASEALFWIYFHQLQIQIFVIKTNMYTQEPNTCSFYKFFWQLS